MNITLKVITRAQFVRMLVKEARRRRKAARPLPGRKYLTQSEVAGAAGYNPCVISRWNTGKREPSVRQALDYLQAVSEAA